MKKRYSPFSVLVMIRLRRLLAVDGDVSVMWGCFHRYDSLPFKINIIVISKQLMDHEDVKQGINYSEHAFYAYHLGLCL